jgi:hypothetical protein
MSETQELSSRPPGESSVRCRRLLSALETTLERSKDKLDLPQILRGFYGSGDDSDTAASMIFQQDEALLEGLLRGMIDKAHRRVVQDTEAFLSDRGIDGVLARLDSAAARLDREEADKAGRRTAALASARLACRRSNMPPNLGHDSVLTYHAYSALARDAAELEREIENGERAIRELKDAKEKLARRIRRRVRSVLSVVREVELSADMSAEVL